MDMALDSINKQHTHTQFFQVKWCMLVAAATAETKARGWLELRSSRTARTTYTLTQGKKQNAKKVGSGCVAQW
jgi:hypothetical protein